MKKNQTDTKMNAGKMKIEERILNFREKKIALENLAKALAEKLKQKE